VELNPPFVSENPTYLRGEAPRPVAKRIPVWCPGGDMTSTTNKVKVLIVGQTCFEVYGRSVF